MTDFERELVKSFNRFFEQGKVEGIAYRLKQHRFASQIVDVLVDSSHKDFYLGIECKSVSTDKGAVALYFTQHFSAGQIPRIDDFLKKSGRRGVLAVELRRGSGKSRGAHIIKWTELRKRYAKGSVGFTVDEIVRSPEIHRKGAHYVIEPRVWGD
ncbi:MAG: hypothetical protein QMC78_02005 [Methanocellales archaeon]|nr:hypothetical protein [Methanocellales archaeon]